MELTDKEAANLLFVRNKCVGWTGSDEICQHCPFYEGYCQFAYYLRSQIKKGAEMNDVFEDQLDDIIERRLNEIRTKCRGRSGKMRVIVASFLQDMVMVLKFVEDNQ